MLDWKRPFNAYQYVKNKRHVHHACSVLGIQKDGDCYIEPAFLLPELVDGSSLLHIIFTEIWFARYSFMSHSVSVMQFAVHNNTCLSLWVHLGQCGTTFSA